MACQARRWQAAASLLQPGGGTVAPRQPPPSLSSGGGFNVRGFLLFPFQIPSAVLFLSKIQFFLKDINETTSFFFLKEKYMTCPKHITLTESLILSKIDQVRPIPLHGQFEKTFKLDHQFVQGRKVTLKQAIR